MYLALFSVGFGSALTFFQAAALFNLLSLDNYVEFRAVLNTMNVAAPFLCLGFDNASPVLKRLDPGFPFIWNLLLLHLCIFVLLNGSAVLLSDSSTLQPLALGLAAATTVAASLMVANHYRTIGAMRHYFLSVNIIDKAVRTTIILGLALWIHSVQWWSIAMSVLCLAYVAFISWRTRLPVRLDAVVFRRHVRISLPYVFSALGIIVITRMPFYAAYIGDDALLTAKIDIWLLVSLFILIPALNKSKIEEAVSTGLLGRYLSAMKASWPALLGQEAVIVVGIVTTATGAVLTGHAAKDDLTTIVLPLTVGMLLIASQPNFVQALCFTGQNKQGIRFSLLISAAGLATYLPAYLLPARSIPWLFCVSAGVYCGIGLVVAKSLTLTIADFWRWKAVLLLVTIVTLGMLTADYLLGLRP